MDFDAFIGDILSNGWLIHGVELCENGRVTRAWGDTEEGLHEIYSGTKSVLSVAVGIAWDRGLMDLEKPITAYLPPDRLRALAPECLQAWEKITIRRLLCMSVDGLPFQPEGDSWLDFSLNHPPEHPETPIFHYSNISAYLIAVALTRAVDQDAGQFIEENLLRPLSIGRYTLARCPEGWFYGASGMRLTVHGLGRLGRMLCAGGVWEGRQLVSREYVTLASQVHQPTREGGYGFLFWKDLPGFSIHGKNKQRCYILPEKGRVVTFLSNIETPSNEVQESVKKHLLD